MFLYPYPVYPRRTIERVFKQLYNVTLMLNFGAFIVSYSDFDSRLRNTYTAYWNVNSLQLNPPVQEILQNCTYTNSLQIGPVSSIFDIDAAAVPFHFMLISGFIVGVFVLHGVLTFFDFLVKLFFAMNIRNLRYRGVYIRVNIVLHAILLMLSIAVLTAVTMSKPTRDYLQGYVSKCAETFILNNEQRFVDAEMDTDVVFGTNLQYLQAAIIVNLGGQFIGLLHLLKESLKSTSGKITRNKHPWEEGFFCRPNKPILSEWSFRREKLAELMENGFELNPDLNLLSLRGAQELDDATEDEMQQKQLKEATAQKRRRTLHVIALRQQQEFHEQQRAYRRGSRAGGDSAGGPAGYLTPSGSSNVYGGRGGGRGWGGGPTAHTPNNNNGMGMNNNQHNGFPPTSAEEMEWNYPGGGGGGGDDEGQQALETGGGGGAEAIDMDPYSSEGFLGGGGGGGMADGDGFDAPDAVEDLTGGEAQPTDRAHHHRVHRHKSDRKHRSGRKEQTAAEGGGGPTDAFGAGQLVEDPSNVLGEDQRKKSKKHRKHRHDSNNNGMMRSGELGGDGGTMGVGGPSAAAAASNGGGLMPPSPPPTSLAEQVTIHLEN